MELGDGMVAVVRGLPDAALAVTLLEGSRQYTLMPNAVPHRPVPAYIHVHEKQHPHGCPPPPQHPHACSPPPQQHHLARPPPLHHQHMCPPQPQPHPQPQQQPQPQQLQHCTANELQEMKLHMQCDSGAQAVDGRYASVYKMAHCNVQPTSPPVQLTEFPPQRAELCRGHGNFEVGGLGSGETSFSPTRANGSFRGGMSWPDRGAVFMPRPSHGPDAFANSLRKYPALSPDRSSEMVERLINYSQNKNVKCQQRNQGSPTRSESSNSGQVFDRRSSISATLRCHRGNDSELNFKAKAAEESPTRDGSRKYELEALDCRRSMFGRNYDVRCLRDMSRRVKDSVRNVSTYPYSLPVCPNIKERYDHLPPERKPDINVTNSVNMETQAEIQKVSREVATLPQEKISMRNVAVPLSPCSSLSCSPQLLPEPIFTKTSSCKSIQTCKPKCMALKIRKSAQTCSSIEIPRENKHNTSLIRRSKSQEDLKLNDDQQENLLLLIKKESVRYGDEKKKDKISVVLSDLLNVNQHEAIYFVNNVVYNLKDMFNKSTPAQIDKTRPQTLLVLRNSLQNSSMQTIKGFTDYSIGGISDQDVLNNLDRYNSELVQQIKEWMGDIRELDEVDDSSKQSVANDLAGDIVDRHKYLEINPDSKGSDADELEHLKYQIFKRINKLVGEDNLDTIGRAPDLMSKLRNIPVPILAKPVQNVNTNVPCSKPHCCKSLIKEDHKSEKRRLSSPAGYPCQKCHNSKVEESRRGTGMMIGKQIMEQKKRQSSPAACDATAVTAPDLAKATACKEYRPKTPNAMRNNYQQIRSSPKQRTAATETEIPRTPMTRPRGTSMTEATTTPRTVYPTGRRLSAPSYLPPGVLRSKAACQTPPRGPVFDNIEERYASTSLACPGRTCHQSTHELDVVPPAAAPSIRQLNEQYDEYLKDWVQQIPIFSPNPEEEALADTMRLGIYNGIWKAITKLKMNPSTLNNKFYYQDVLDDEVEELLNLLPQSPELIAKKPLLKSQLIEKTTNMHEQIVSAASPSSYKQQLVENVAHNLPRRTIDHTAENTDHLIEEIQKLNLAEDFIMYTKYREEDKIKANVYRNKLMKHISQLIDEVKRSQGKELKDIDEGIYRDEIMKALYRVPLPGDETIKEEAEEILIGIEIEQWFADLPLFPTANYIDDLCRKRHRNNLAKKLHDLDKQMGLTNCEDQFRQEIYKFMEKLPLRPGEAANIDFMVEELVNRLKNRPRDIVAGSTMRRKSGLAEPNNYDDFSRDMQLCSSFHHGPDVNKAQVNESSYMIVGGERAGASYYAPVGQHVQSRRNTTPESQQQWFSLEETKAPSGMFSEKCGQRSVAQESAHHFRGTETANTQNVNNNQSPCRRVSASMQTAPSVKIQDQVVETAGPSFSPCGENCMPRRGSMRKETQSPHSSQQAQAHSSDQAARVLPPGHTRYCEGLSPSVPESVPGPNSRYPQGSTQPCSSCSAQVQTADYQKSGDPSREFGVNRANAPTMYDFSGEPVGYSTPQQQVPTFHESRPKKRTREVDRPMRDAARRRLDLEDTEDSEREEMRCRCMERVWRSCRKKMPVCMTCDDFDMEFPACFPMRYPPCPYYF